MNDAVTVMVAQRADQSRQVRHVAAHQSASVGVNTDCRQQPLIDHYIENHRPFASLQQHAHGIGSDQARTTGDKNSLRHPGSSQELPLLSQTDHGVNVVIFDNFNAFGSSYNNLKRTMRRLSAAIS